MVGRRRYSGRWSRRPCCLCRARDRLGTVAYCCRRVGQFRTRKESRTPAGFLLTARRRFSGCVGFDRRVIDHACKPVSRWRDFLDGWEKAVFLRLWWFGFELGFFEGTRRQRNQLHFLVGTRSCVRHLNGLFMQAEVKSIDGRVDYWRGLDWQGRTVQWRWIVDIVVEDPKGHFRLSARHARWSTQHSF